MLSLQSLHKMPGIVFFASDDDSRISLLLLSTVVCVFVSKFRLYFFVIAALLIGLFFFQLVHVPKFGLVSTSH